MVSAMCFYPHLVQASLAWSSSKNKRRANPKVSVVPVSVTFARSVFFSRNDTFLYKPKFF